METLLNLLWLVLAVAFALIWRYRWFAARPARDQRKLIECAALICALALLFPVISLTDDLHPETVAVDAASGKRNVRQLLAATTAAQSAVQHSRVHVHAAILPAPVTPVHFVSLNVVPSRPVPESNAWHSASSGRSPPNFSL